MSPFDKPWVRVKRRLRKRLERLPAKMRRDELERALLLWLPQILSVFPEEVKLTWNIDTLEVEIPTRPHYIEIVDDLHSIIEEAVARVDVSDTRQLTDEQFAQRARGLRGA